MDINQYYLRTETAMAFARFMSISSNFLFQLQRLVKTDIVSF